MYITHLDNGNVKYYSDFNTKFAHIYWLVGIVYYGERGANTRGNGNNLANGGFIEMNLFKATS